MGDRIRVDDVRSMGRSTEGARVMNMADDDQVCGVASVVEPSEEITEEATVGGQDEPVAHRGWHQRPHHRPGRVAKAHRLGRVQGH